MSDLLSREAGKQTNGQHHSGKSSSSAGAQYTQLIAPPASADQGVAKSGPGTQFRPRSPSSAKGGIILSKRLKSTTGAQRARATAGGRIPACRSYILLRRLQTIAAQLGSAASRPAQVRSCTGVGSSRPTNCFSGLSTRRKPRIDVWMSPQRPSDKRRPIRRLTRDHRPHSRSRPSDPQTPDGTACSSTRGQSTQAGPRPAPAFVVDVCRAEWTPAAWTVGRRRHPDPVRLVSSQVIAYRQRRRGFVLAARSYRAVGGQLTCVFVATGPPALAGPQAVVKFAQRDPTKGRHGRQVDPVMRRIGTSKTLSGITDQGSQRKIIGNLFVEIFDENPRGGLAQAPSIRIESDGKTGKAH